MARGKRTDQETVNKILDMSDDGYNHYQIARLLNMDKTTVAGIVKRGRIKIHYPPHCYTCEYCIYADMVKTNNVLPAVKGCLMHCDTPKTCRKWLDDQITAEKVKADLQGK